MKKLATGTLMMLSLDQDPQGENHTSLQLIEKTIQKCLHAFLKHIIFSDLSTFNDFNINGRIGI